MDSEDETQTNRRTGRGRGRGRGRPPGRPSKKAKKKTEKVVKKESNVSVKKETEKSRITGNEDNKESVLLMKTESIDFDENLGSDLTSHSMTSFVNPMSTPLHRNEPLNWKVRVHLIGEKVVNPRIHCCEKCLLPILVYGRMIPCRHVFCLNCCKLNNTLCPRCDEKVLRVETTALGTVFMCQIESCKRTYLSQRDLQAHIEHRHLKRQISASALSSCNNTNISTAPTLPKEQPTSASTVRPVSYNSNTFQSPIPVVSSRSNLITVPIQEEVSAGMNAITPGVGGQSSIMVSTPLPVSNYPPQQNAYSPHMQWSQMQNSGGYAYRPPTWPPINPFPNPYNRPFYPQ